MPEPDSNDRTRPAPAPLSARAKPTPVRALNGDPPPAPEADLAEAALEVGGEQWTVQVLGRAGGVSGVAPPLLLLGFWSGRAAGEPELERLVSGASLASLSAEELETALAGAKRPPDPDRKTTFFAESSHPRRR